MGHLPRRRERCATASARKISSWKRVGANTIPHVAKATGIYLNSMLAVHEAQRAGYDEAILLTDEGFVADGSGENVFVVKDGRIWTPPLSTSILPGHHARQRDPDRAGPRLRRRGGEPDPLRPLPRRRDLHDRHRRRGDAGALGRRPRDRRRPGHARAAEGVPRHGARQDRALGPLARPRRGRAARAAPRREGRHEAASRSRRRSSTSATRSSSSRCCARPALARARRSTASRSCSPRRSARRYAAAVSSGTAGLHLLCRIAGVGEGDEVITSPYSFVASANCFIYEGATPGLRRHRRAAR